MNKFNELQCSDFDLKSSDFRLDFIYCRYLLLKCFNYNNFVNNCQKSLEEPILSTT